MEKKAFRNQHSGTVTRSGFLIGFHRSAIPSHGQHDPNRKILCSPLHRKPRGQIFPFITISYRTIGFSDRDA
jgi:hypothetical protein